MILNKNLEPSLFGSFFDVDLIKILKVNYLIVNLIKESGEKEDNTICYYIYIIFIINYNNIILYSYHISFCLGKLQIKKKMNKNKVYGIINILPI